MLNIAIESTILKNHPNTTFIQNAINVNAFLSLTESGNRGAIIMNYLKFINTLKTKKRFYNKAKIKL